MHGAALSGLSTNNPAPGRITNAWRSDLSIQIHHSATIKGLDCSSIVPSQGLITVTAVPRAIISPNFLCCSVIMLGSFGSAHRCQWTVVTNTPNSKASNLVWQTVLWFTAYLAETLYNHPAQDSGADRILSICLQLHIMLHVGRVRLHLAQKYSQQQVQLVR